MRPDELVANMVSIKPDDVENALIDIPNHGSHFPKPNHSEEFLVFCDVRRNAYVQSITRKFFAPRSMTIILHNIQPYSLAHLQESAGEGRLLFLVAIGDAKSGNCVSKRELRMLFTPIRFLSLWSKPDVLALSPSVAVQSHRTPAEF